MSAAWSYYPPIESFVLRSDALDQDYHIQVMIPLIAEGETTRFPVLYLTDGNAYFDACAALARHLQMAPTTQRFILVGIGYPSDTPCGGLILRARDLTFEGYPELDVSPPRLRGVLLPDAGASLRQGGRFLDFIADRLIPTIETRYPVLPGRHGYFGHSAGGGLGLYALSTQPSLFDRYIISSPGLIFDGRSSAGIDYRRHDVILDRLRRALVEDEGARGVRLYASVGEGEDGEADAAPWKLTTHFRELIALLEQASPDWLAWQAALLPEEGHATIWAGAFLRGARFVFGADERQGIEGT